VLGAALRVLACSRITGLRGVLCAPGCCSAGAWAQPVPAASMALHARAIVSLFTIVIVPRPR
ncbi:MAG: hypothetical protein ACREUC_11170, partial [Steroidobacteraceae bacterium]